MNTATLSVILKAVDNLSPTLQKAEGRLARFDANIKKFSQGLSTAIKGVTATMSALTTLITSATYFGAKFEKTFQNALTMFDASQEQIDNLKRSLTRLAQEYGVSFEQLNNALYTLGSAGIDATHAIDVLEKTLKASAAGATDVQLTFEGAIGIINAYGMSIEDLNTVYAMQFEAVKKGLLTYEELARDFGTIIPAARNLGVSLREAMAGYVALTTAGIRSAEAANAVEGAFQDIMQQADKFEKLGITIYDANGQFMGLTNIVEQLYEKMKGLSDAEKRAFLEQLSLSETGTRAILTWVNNLEKYRDVLDGIKGSTEALNDAFAKQTGSISFLLAKLKSAFGTLNLALFEAIRPELVKFLTLIIGKMSDLANWIRANASVLGPMIWSLLKFGGLLLGVLIPLKFFAETIRAVAHPVVLVLLGIAGAIAGIWKLQNKGKGFVDFLLWLGQVAESIWKTFQKWGEEIAQLMEARNAQSFWERLVVFLEWFFAKAGTGAANFLDWLGNKLLAFLGWLWEQFKKGMEQGWEWLKELFAWLRQLLFETIVVPIVDALQQIFKKSVDWMKDVGSGILSGLKATGKGLATFGGWLIGKGWLWGKQEGGYTGDGPVDQIAGFVHAGEYVIPAWMVKKFPVLVAVLERIRKRGYQAGGPVGAGVGTTQTVALDLSPFTTIVGKIQEQTRQAQAEAKKWWEEFLNTAKDTWTRFKEWYSKSFIAEILSETESFKSALDRFLISLFVDLYQLPGGTILAQFVQTLWDLISGLESVQKLLNPIGTILEAMMKVVSPIIDSALMPFVELLTILGQTIGTLLVPLLESFNALLQALAQIFLWLYNTILRPIAKGLYIVFSIVADAFNVLYNVVSDIVRALTFGIINLGRRTVKGLDRILREAEEKFPEAQFGSTAESYTQEYVANVTRTGPETVYNIINLYANESFIMDHKQKFYDFLAEAIQELIDTGQIKFA